MTVVGVVYGASLLLSAGGMVLRSTALQLFATAFSFVLAVLLYWLFAPPEPRLAVALLPLAFTHCVIQGAGELRADVRLRRFALLPFAGFLVVLGYLIARSTFAPAALGVVIVVAGLAWLITVAPRTPIWATLAVVAFGVIAELTLATWLLVAPSP